MNRNKWYLVKRNWPQTATRHAKYAGVGGDVWPLPLEDSEGRRIHAAMEAAREYIRVNEAEELLCGSLAVAEEYWTESDRRFGDAWLLEVSTSGPDVAPEAGVDIGFPSGGFSLVETELITQALPGPPLNQWGLIDSATEAASYLESRKANEDLEELDGIALMAIRILRRGIRR